MHWVLDFWEDMAWAAGKDKIKLVVHALPRWQSIKVDSAQNLDFYFF